MAVWDTGSATGCVLDVKGEGGGHSNINNNNNTLHLAASIPTRPMRQSTEIRETYNENEIIYLAHHCINRGGYARIY